MSQSKRPARAVAVGAQVGRWRATEILGEGGFATVFKGVAANGETVALKVLHGTREMRLNPTFRERFEREARLVAELDHPNVVDVYEFGTTGELEQPYLAMRFLDGYDLGFLLTQVGRFSARRALALLLPCLEALAAGHALGIVHKDLKPGNLFVIAPSTPAESMVILDYGIARENRPGAQKSTRVGEVAGTPQYLAPEYIDHGIARPVFDVYQSGLILGEMLIGHRLVASDNPITAVLEHHHGIGIPGRLRGTSLEPVLARALAKDPAERYQNCGELRAALLEIDAASLEREIEGRFASNVVARPDTDVAPVNPADLKAYLQKAGLSNPNMEPAEPLGLASTLDPDDVDVSNRYRNTLRNAPLPHQLGPSVGRRPIGAAPYVPHAKTETELEVWEDARPTVADVPFAHPDAKTRFMQSAGHPVAKSFPWLWVGLGVGVAMGLLIVLALALA